MGFVRKLTGVSDQTRAARGAASTQAEAGQAAIETQEEARARAQGFFQPFAGAAERGVEASQFLADPQAQFDFLQQNPLFQLALENANVQTQQSATARGRLSAGDTLQQLSSNVLLSAQPLIDRQRQDVTALLDLGTGVATSQANIETGQAARIGGLQTDIGAATAAGQIARGGGKAAGFEQTIGLAGGIGGAVAGAPGLISGVQALAPFLPSDERLKENIKLEGTKDGNNWYSWDWNKLAGEIFGLFGADNGVIAQEVMVDNPEAVIMNQSGFYKVKYGEL